MEQGDRKESSSVIDVVFPVPPSSVGIATTCLNALYEHTQDYRLIVILDGGKRQAFQPLEEEIERLKKENPEYEYVVIHNAQTQFYNQCIIDGLRNVKSKFAVTLSPEILIEDKYWCWKMMCPFWKDSHAVMSLAGEANTKSSSMLPFKVDKRKEFKHGRFTMLHDMRDDLSQCSGDIIEWIRDKLWRDGCNCWSVPGVRYSILEHKEHLACRV